MSITCSFLGLNMMCGSPVLYPGLDLDQGQDGFQDLAGRARKHLQHLLLHNHLVHDCLEVAQGADHLLLVLLQPTDLLDEPSSRDTVRNGAVKSTLWTFHEPFKQRPALGTPHSISMVPQFKAPSGRHVCTTVTVQAFFFFSFSSRSQRGCSGNTLITTQKRKKKKKLKPLGSSGGVHSGSCPLPFMSL